MLKMYHNACMNILQTTGFELTKITCLRVNKGCSLPATIGLLSGLLDSAWLGCREESSESWYFLRCSLFSSWPSCATSLPRKVV